MIDLLVIAGSKTTAISRYLNDKGTLNIFASYESFELARAELESKIIHVQKTIYYFDPSIQNIRKEMEVLTGLLQSTSFFLPGEIIFICQAGSSETDIAQRYFTTVMKQRNYLDYDITVIQSDAGYDDIYSLILGSTRKADIKNEYKKIYRVERESKANRVYDSENTSDSILLTNEHTRVKAYNQNKQILVNTDSNHKFTTNSKSVQKFDNPSLGQIAIQDIANTKNTLLVTGARKSGVTTWACAVAQSTHLAGHSVCLLDFTDNADASDVLTSMGVVNTFISMPDLMQLKSLNSTLYTCAPSMTTERTVINEFIQWFYVEHYLMFDYVIIACSLQQEQHVADIIQSNLLRILVCSCPTTFSLKEASKILADSEQRVKTLLVLNETLHLIASQRYLQPQAVRELVSANIQIIKPVRFETFNNLSIFTSLELEVRI